MQSIVTVINNNMSESPKTKRRRVTTNETNHVTPQIMGIVKKRRDINPVVKHLCAQIIDNILNLKYSNEHVQLILSTMENINNDRDIDEEQYILKYEQLTQTLINDVKLNSFKN